MRHVDAVGYLSDFAKETKISWFDMICDIAAAGISSLNADDIDLLFAIFIGRASYLPAAGAPSGAAAIAAVAPADFLEILAEFSNFKQIGKELRLDFKKRLTLIFGTNGSGKSSLCESLRVLASTEPPTRPLQNVRNGTRNPTTFKFKFRSEATPIEWSPAMGFGTKQTAVKYFDSAIAVKNIKRAVDPGRVIEVAPFKLFVFEGAASLTNLFRQALQERQSENSIKLADALKDIRSAFASFEGRPLASINEGTVGILDEVISTGEAFVAADDLNAKRAAAVEMEKATSEDGLKLLKSEEREMMSLLNSLATLSKLATDLKLLDPASKAKALVAKREAQTIFAGALVPDGATLDLVKTLARAASSLCHLEAADGESCPLCRRDLGATEIDLFQQYNNLLVGELERDIATLSTDLSNAKLIVETMNQTAINDWRKNVTIAPDLLAEAMRIGTELIGGSNLAAGVLPPAQIALGEAETLLATKQVALEDKTKAIEAAGKGRDELLAKLAAHKKEIEPLAYAESIQNNLSHLKQARGSAKRAAFFAKELPTFQALLKKITNASKKAHEDLVVADFETRLNAEYKRLTERDMAAFGVTLARKGVDASITVLPQIGGKDIDGVLSEGEQRVHALALFFAEMETCPQSVVVFDDPVSSFDYNFIENYCGRVRDFAKAHLTHQIVVLTHNWEFFVNLQTMLNKANLTNDLSVQVLENCSTVGEYSEDVTTLKTEIEAVLARPAEPSRFEKEGLAGNMRILIEAIVNTHVFAKQRHQYKQKSQPVSNFDDYTKVVPLLRPEAIALRDLYAKLSVSEHHDPRNAYVNTDRMTFSARYDEVIAIEAAIITRK